MKFKDLDIFQEEIHQLAKEKGWWKDADECNECGACGYCDPRKTGNEIAHILAKLALIHSEVSEAIEAVRIDGDIILPYKENGKPEGAAIELADAVIRILDLLERHAIKLSYCMRLKHEYNKERSYKHGNKYI